MFVRQRLWMMVYIVPCFIIIALFTYYPILQSVYYSFLDWNLTGAKKWIGLQNYSRLFADPYFLISLKNSFIFITASIIFQLGIALLLALLIYHKIRGGMVFRTIFFTPVVMSSVAVALMFWMVYEPSHGLLNSALNAVGLSSWTKQWLADPNTAFYYAIVPKIWHFVGLYVIIYFTGLVGIPEDVYESAAIDGARAFVRFFYITLPMMKEVMVMSIILISINTWKSFEEIWVLTGGGPSHSTEIIGTYMVNRTFTTFQYGYGSSISTIILIVGFLITVGLNYIFSLGNRD